MATSEEEVDEVGTIVVADFEEAQPSIGLGLYVVSRRGKGSGRRTPHFTGARHRTPGIDYAQFEVFGDVRPPASQYTDVCKQCWPADRGIIRSAESDDEFDGSTSTSDGDDNEKGPEVAAGTESQVIENPDGKDPVFTPL